MKLLSVRTAVSVYDRVDTALLERAGLVAGFACAAGIALRFWLAAGPFLSPQEAWYCLIANSLDPATLLENSRRAHDPPLLLVVLGIIRRIGRSEILLRSVPVLLGGLSAGVAYLWLKRRISKAAALFAACALALSPAIVALDSGVRAEPLVACFMIAGLYALDRALDGDSFTWMMLFVLLLWMAVLSGFAAAAFATAAAVYYLIRVPSSPTKISARRIWVMGQAGALALFWHLYSWLLLGSPAAGTERQGVAPWLRGVFPARGEDPGLHLWYGTLGQFNFVFPSLPSAVAGLILFALALAALIRRDKRSCTATAALLVTPFLVCYLLSFVEWSPYGASRETAFLSLFVVSGVAIGTDVLFRGRVLPVVLLSVLLVGFWHLPKYRDRFGVPYWRSQKELMHEAAAYLRTTLAPGSFLLTDAETRLCVGYYLDPDGWVPVHGDLPNEDLVAGIRIWAARWSFSGFADLQEDLELARPVLPRPTGQIRVVDGGYDNNLGEEASGEGNEPLTKLKDFGGAVTIFRLDGE